MVSVMMVSIHGVYGEYKEEAQIQKEGFLENLTSEVDLEG